MKRIKRLFPHIKDIGLTGGRGWGWRLIQQHEEHHGRKITVPSQHMSDGVLRVLAVACLLHLDNPPTVVMLEEPENGIHPRLLREVVGILRDMSLAKAPNECQVFLTTHSPYVLDEFISSPQEVFAMDRNKDEPGVSIVQLSTNEQLSDLQSGFASLGEAWFSGLVGAATKG
jgi:predicted ATPase